MNNKTNKNHINMLTRSKVWLYMWELVGSTFHIGKTHIQCNHELAKN